MSPTLNTPYVTDVRSLWTGRSALTSVTLDMPHGHDFTLIWIFKIGFDFDMLRLRE